MKYNRQIFPSQAAFTLRARVEPTESCTTNELRLCVRFVMCVFMKYVLHLRGTGAEGFAWPCSVNESSVKGGIL